MALGRETLLLLACTRVSSPLDDKADIQDLLQKNLNWDHLIQAASQHGVLPLVYQCLSEAGRDFVPPTEMARLRHEFYRNTVWNLFLTGKLLEILSLLEAHGIAAVPYKGPVLAVFTYGDISLRQFSDLDIFLRLKDFPFAKKLLISQGYRPEISLPPAKEAVHLKSLFHFAFTDEATVELHWRFVPKYFHFPLETKGVWERVERRTLNGREVLNFSPEDLILILCAHGTDHSWERIIWIRDFATLIVNHPGMKWGKVLSMARELRCERMLYLGLWLANDLMAAPLPDDLRQRLQAQTAMRSLARQVGRLLFREAHYKSVILFQTLIFQLRVREGLWEKLRYCFSLLFTLGTTDWEFISLPRGLTFLYYLIRPFRLVLKFGFGIESAP